VFSNVMGLASSSIDLSSPNFWAKPLAHRFDIIRDPNPHVGFGAASHHFCLGVHLARPKITTIFRELFRRAPDIRPVSAVRLLESNFSNGIKSLPCELTRTRD
jgi:cytochrome P450